MNKLFFFIAILAIFIVGCSENNLEKKGFAVSEISEDNSDANTDGFNSDTLMFQTRPRNILLTGFSEHRLVPILKVNYQKNSKVPFVGDLNTISSYSLDEYREYQTENFIPGLHVVEGYNFVNISHHNTKTNKDTLLFSNYVLIKTLYFPSFTQDSLNENPITRNYYFVSAYDEDTNKDGFINSTDLRRFYYFDLNCQNKQNLIPQNYSALSSEFDSSNDYMYIFAQHDKNENGKTENEEAVKVFWIDLKNPMNNGVLY